MASPIIILKSLRASIYITTASSPMHPAHVGSHRPPHSLPRRKAQIRFVVPVLSSRSSLPRALTSDNGASVLFHCRRPHQSSDSPQTTSSHPPPHLLCAVRRRSHTQPASSAHHGLDCRREE
ncbi:hypothetical protein M0R45_025847 [Rubus argutus]|uniref:Uncharacterized protein n=1 Tax=Rubus argutus TaxID=59490 RepID=A0AAW1WY43_RUBAR